MNKTNIQDSSEERENEPISANCQQIIDRIQVSPRMSELEDQLRESIWQQISRRREKAQRRTFRLRLTAIAASACILIGLSIFASYQWGYQQRNTQLVHLSSPAGMRSSIELADGTKVTMNAGSTLSYPAEFVSDIREVEISGEAYFDVTFDPKRPFVVKAENIRVRVLSTLFNVKAYSDDKAIEVTLEEGLIEIESDAAADPILIRPGEQLRYDKASRQSVHREVTPEIFTGWRSGKLYFVNTPLADIARELERKFSVRISIDSDELRDIAFTGDFVRNESLEQILRVMTTDNRISYTIADSDVRIYKN